MAVTKKMQADFNFEFSLMMDKFLIGYEDQIEDVVDLDMLITEAFDEWANENGL